MDKEIEGIVEIGSKDVVERRASATGVLNLSEASAQAIQNKTVKKGDVLDMVERLMLPVGLLQAVRVARVDPFQDAQPPKVFQRYLQVIYSARSAHVVGGDAAVPLLLLLPERCQPPCRA